MLVEKQVEFTKKSIDTLYKTKVNIMHSGVITNVIINNIGCFPCVLIDHWELQDVSQIFQDERYLLTIVMKSLFSKN